MSKVPAETESIMEEDGPPRVRSHDGPVFPIVGVGASAGGLEAFTQLLEHLKPNTGMGVVLVQHLAPSHASVLTELLGRATSVPVTEVKDRTRVQPNHIYVIPPNVTMSISGGLLRLQARRAGSAGDHAIDAFFKSLAEDQGNRAIGVILSGTATDGTLGLEAIKAEGGITFAQESKSAKYDGMPQSAIASGCVDFVLTPQQIGYELGQLSTHPYIKPADPAQPEQLIDEPNAFKKLLTTLRQATGVDFNAYKGSTLHRRIARRLALSQKKDLEEYLKWLRENPKEVNLLYEDLLINVTSFFRDSQDFEFLKKKVFPKICLQASPEDPVRMWVAGCSTGQEAYSLAMAFSEFADARRQPHRFQVFATDANEAALEKARAAVYPKALLADVSAPRLRRFFTETEGGYIVAKSIREICIFARHNLVADPPFSRLDIITCRNVLIYLHSEIQQRVLRIFHYGLKPGGFLWLGNSESIGSLGELFAPADRKHKVYIKKSARAAPQLTFPAADRIQRPSSRAQREANGLFPQQIDAQREADRIMLSRFAPASVLVNSEFEVIQFRGDSGAFLKPAPGKPSLNLLKMLREGLMLPIRSAIHKARKEGNPVSRQGLRFKENGGIGVVNVQVLPLKNLPAEERHYLVTFEPELPPANPTKRAGERPVAAPIKRAPVSDPKGAERAAIRRLTQELADTRDYLQSIVEQYDAASEELQSAGEEAQSSNEELQSINEELETSKEELQASNEELSTVNQELQNRSVEVGALNNDLINLLSSVSIPVVMVGRDLSIRRITPATEKALNVIASDIGRSISDIKLKVEVPGLEEAITDVIDTITAREMDVQDRTGRWHSLRIRPYKTLENKIDGAVIALVDVDALKRSEQNAKQAREYAQAIVETVREGMLVLDSDLRVRTASRSFYELFKLSRAETEGKTIYELGNGQWDIPALRTLLEEILPEKAVRDNFEVAHTFPEIGHCIMLLNARKMVREGDVFLPSIPEQRRQTRRHGPHPGQPQTTGGHELILLAIEDVTARRRSENALKASELRYRRLFESAKDGMLIVDPTEGRIIDVNPHMSELLGYAREEFLGKELWQVGLLPDRQAHNELLHQLGQTQIVRYDELPVTDPSGRKYTVELIANRYEEAGRSVVQCNVRDVTERQQMSHSLQESAKFRRLMIDNVPDHAIFTMDAAGLVNTWNKGAERVFGFADAEIIGQSGDILFTPEDRATGEPQKETETARTTGHAVDERWHLRKDGTRFLASGGMTPIRDEAGTLRGFTKVARDETEREKSRAALVEQARLLDLSNDAIVARDLDHRITYWNHGAVELYGFTQGEVLGQNLHELLKCNFPEPLPSIMDQLRRDNRWSGEITQVAADGRVITVSSRWALDRDKEGRPSAILETNTDVTERKRIDDALKEAMDALAHQASELERLVNDRTGELQYSNRQLEAFVYTIAHDLRAPLRAMQGFSTLLATEAGPNLSETARDYLARISRSAKFMDSLLMDLLSFSRVSQQKIDLAPFNLEAVVQTTVSELAAEIKEKNGHVELVGPWPAVLGHRETTSHVLMNLLTNALKFVAPGVHPQVRIRAETRGSRVRIWVEDNGVGIDPDHQEQIFRIFQRLHTDQYAGTGIGLAIVQRGIERMGGTVGVESAPGQGSRFWFELKAP